MPTTHPEIDLYGDGDAEAGDSYEVDLYGDREAEVEVELDADAVDLYGEADVDLYGDGEAEAEAEVEAVDLYGEAEVELYEDDDAEVYALTTQAARAYSGVVREEGAAVRPPPDTNVSAEVILITTSLGSVRKMYFDSIRGLHILNCKGTVYYNIDINRDMSDSADLCDQQLFEEWKAEGFLLDDHSSVSLLGIQIPQVIIDGVPIGDHGLLQDMEEDGDLDWVLARAACPACLHEKDPNDLECAKCQTKFRTLIPQEKIKSKEVQQIFRGCNYGGHGGGSAVFAHNEFAKARRRTMELAEENVGIFGEPEEDE